MLEALEGKRTIKETTSVLAGCGKTMSARETGGRARRAKRGGTQSVHVAPFSRFTRHAPWTLGDFFSILLP